MDLHAIRVRLCDEHEQCFDGSIDDVWYGDEGAAMSISFGLRQGPSLCLGRAAQLSFEGGPFDQSVQVAGLIVGRSESDLDRYQLRFGEAAYPAIGRLFDSRRQPRVAPPDGEPVTAALRSLDTGGKAAAGELVDVSLDGAALAMPLLQERAMATLQRVRVALPLPGVGEPLVFDAEIRRRALRENQVVYGIQFDPGRENDPRFLQLAAYVDRRIDELREAGTFPYAYDGVRG